MPVRILESSASQTPIASGDNIFVGSGVSIVTANSSGLNASSADSFVISVHGTVAAGDGNGIRLGDSTLDGRKELTIGSTGTVASFSNGNGILAEGLSVFITNFGQIFGAAGVNAFSADGASIANFGTISGTFATGVRVISSDNVTITNAGTITGAGGMDVLFSGSFALNNSGGIFSTTNAAVIKAVDANAGISITNSGLISGFDVAFDGGSFDDFISNSGRIIGDVEFGDGDDVYNGSNGVLEGIIYGRKGEDSLRGGSDEDQLRGGAGDDFIRGRDGADVLKGDVGNDTLKGGSGIDTLIGGGGNDAIVGGSDDDRLDGGAGEDVLNGGRDDDRLTGGEGADVFVFGRDAGNDVITDFENGVDQIDLTALGIRPGNIDLVLDAVSNAGGGNSFLDLSELGANGSVLIQNLAFADLDATDFVL